MSVLHIQLRLMPTSSADRVHNGKTSRPRGRDGRHCYLLGLAKTFLYSAASDAEGIISIRSVSCGISLRGSLLRGTQGFVYAFGSSIVTVSSRVFWFARWYRSSTRISVLFGLPALTSHVRSSMPTD